MSIRKHRHLDVNISKLVLLALIDVSRFNPFRVCNVGGLTLKSVKLNKYSCRSFSLRKRPNHTR